MPLGLFSRSRGLVELGCGFVFQLTDPGDGLVSRDLDEAPRPATAVDVRDKQVVEDVASLAAGTRQVDDLGIAQREALELRAGVAIDDELLAVIEEETVVGREEARETAQEGAPHVHRAVVDDVPHIPALIQELEERADVLAEGVLSDLLHRLHHTVRQFVELVAPTRPHVRVQPSHRLQERHRVDDVVPPHTLVPAHAVVEDEVLGFGGEPVEEHDDHIVVAEVAEEHVRGHLDPVRVQDLEHATLPLLGGVEVDGRAQRDLDLRVELYGAQTSGNPLEAIDHVDGLAEREDPTSLRVVSAPHAECDVGDLVAELERLDEPLEGTPRQHIALVGVHLQGGEACLLNETPQHDAVVGLLSQGGLKNPNAIFC